MSGGIFFRLSFSLLSDYTPVDFENSFGFTLALKAVFEADGFRLKGAMWTGVNGYATMNAQTIEFCWEIGEWIFEP